jgi:threonyl-tRNA synthetase
MRVEVDGRSERLPAKIRDAQLQKIPYMLICGDRDIASGAVSVRDREKGDLGPTPVDRFLGDVQDRLAP